MELDHEFVVYSHRPHRLQPVLAESLARTYDRTFRLTVIREPGTAAQNLNRALDAARARLVFILDEDVEFFQTGWVAAMLLMAQRPDFGLGGCLETRSRDLMATLPRAADYGGRVERVPHQAGYVHLIDRQRCAGLRFDEKCPGRTGMTDWDMCVQVRKVRGLGVYRHHGCIVLHPGKPADDAWRKANDHDSWSEQQAWDSQQVQFMNQKWGPGQW